MIVADRNADGARSVATELGDPHSSATVEVTDEDSVRALFDAAPVRSTSWSTPPASARSG